MLLTVTVSQQDIDAGCRRNAYCCPVANALLRAGCEWCRVGVSQITYSYESVTYRHYPGDQLVSFIRFYDAGDVVTPSVFQIQGHKI
jgi:hypothetical protein